MKTECKIIQGDCVEVLKKLPAESVQCCVTSPPYWGLRDYGCDGQIGLEETPEAYVAKMVAVFSEVKRVLRDDGTCWVNLGDSYASTGRSDRKESPGVGATQEMKAPGRTLTWQAGGGSNFSWSIPSFGTQIKPKDLVGIPWRVAFALQADGWYLRQDIIWHKPNPMPESVTDRCTKAHEYIFLLSKSERYHYDNAAIKEPCKDSSIARLGQDIENQKGSDRVPGKTNGKMKAVKFGGNKQCPDTRLQSGKEWNPSQGGGGTGFRGHSGNAKSDGTEYILSNKRSVWSVTTKGFKGAHFATFPPDLIQPMILAGCPEGGTVLDPFGGSGTTGMVAESLGRNAILIELNPAYIEIANGRTTQPSML
jgi:DNA modification methylase